VKLRIYNVLDREELSSVLVSVGLITFWVRNEQFTVWSKLMRIEVGSSPQVAYLPFERKVAAQNFSSFSSI
jgi:hypothetical protein